MFEKKSDAVGQDVVLQTLSTVMDPDLHRNIVELGFVKNLQIRGGDVSFDVELTTPACPVKDMLRDECQQKVAALAGVDRVSVNMTARVTARKHESKMVMAGVKNVVAVASGKGGVGKSTCAVNLAAALRATGASVGLMDGDVYGPSVPMMLGLARRPEITPAQKIIPIDHLGLKVVSMGLLSDENTPVIWRGPMVSQLIQQFLGGVEWGELDYLIVDMPPGTGDAQLTLCQQAPLAGAVIVTTPQAVSLIDARKGLKMFEKVNVPVLGIIENMSYFECGHCGERTEIFRHGGGREIAAELGVPFLGEIPLDPEVVVGGDEGQPIVLRKPDSPVSKAYAEIARNVAARVSVANAEAPAPAKVSFAWDSGKKADA